IDRVFSNGWAFDFSLDGRLDKKLGHLRVHLIGIGGGDAGTYERHGYSGAMTTQIDHGIFDYCGASVVTSTLMLDSETQDPAIHLAAARAIGRGLFDGSAGCEARAA
ncbi:MAG: NAD(P)H-dependent oxidoreductase, partial [Phreatobacter sp.]